MGHYQNKKIGQVFLIDPNIPDWILDESDIQPDEHIVEIGCGEAVLTRPISQRCQQLTIIEMDKYYLDYALKRCDKNCTIVPQNQNFERCGFDEVSPTPFKVIANIPYQISSSCIQELVKHRDHCSQATLMVQKEFADRLLADPGTKAYGSLSIFAQFYMDIFELFQVPRHCFKPVPKVDSTVIKIIPQSAPLFKVDEERFFSIVKAAFWGRRKTLMNCLKQSPHFSTDKDLNEIPLFKENPKIRGEALSIEGFYELYCALSDDNIQ